MNRTTVLGRLGKDPELKTSQKGTSYMMTTLAVDYYDGVKKETATTWYPITVFGKTAEYVAKVASKGSTLLVDGRMERNDKDDKTYWSLLANEVKVLGGTKKAETETKTETADDDIPF